MHLASLAWKSWRPRGCLCGVTQPAAVATPPSAFVRRRGPGKMLQTVSSLVLDFSQAYFPFVALRAGVEVELLVLQILSGLVSDSDLLWIFHSAGICLLCSQCCGPRLKESPRSYACPSKASSRLICACTSKLPRLLDMRPVPLRLPSMPTPEAGGAKACNVIASDFFADRRLCSSLGHRELASQHGARDLPL